MKATVNIVAALIAKIRKAKDVSRKEVVNPALRDGSEGMLIGRPRPKKFRTEVHSPGRCYLPNLDNTAEVLAFAEGEYFK